MYKVSNNYKKLYHFLTSKLAYNIHNVVWFNPRHVLLGALGVNIM